MNRQTPLLCFAHRGGKGHGLENTLATIRQGLSFNPYGIEIDVWNINGNLLVTHDRKLGRVIQGEGSLLDLEARDLPTLQHHDGSPIATLYDVLALVGDKAKLNIEIKGPDCVALVVEEVMTFIEKTGIDVSNYIMSSFDHQQLYWLKENAPQFYRGVLISHIPLDYAACCESLGAYSFHPCIDFYSKALIDDAKKRKVKTFIYTVNDRDDLEAVSAYGVDGVFSDFPDRVIAFNQSLPE